MAQDGEGGREVDVQRGNGAPFLGAAANPAVTVHPGVGAFYDPPFPGLDRGDLVDVAEFVEQVPKTGEVMRLFAVARAYENKPAVAAQHRCC